MASRPLVQVYGAGGKVVNAVPTPQIMLSPIRHDVVQFVQTNLRRNKRQAFAVSFEAGMQSSAESWGTGRAVARIPRVPGGGTHRAGQGAFGNMCRGGRIFSPVRVWRRWHRKVNVNQKRYAVASALAASSVPALVMARGHRISNIPEVPLVIDNKIIDPITRTKFARALLEQLKAYDDVVRVAESEKKRSGRAQWRNRAKTRRVGPLIVMPSSRSVTQAAFRNLPGVEVVGVRDLNILRLAPGGHLGRFIIWTQGAFDQLDHIWGTLKKQSALKKNYFLPRPILTNPDLARIFNSDQVAQIVRARKALPKAIGKKPNYITNKTALAKINPYHLVQRRVALQTAIRNKRSVAVRRAKFHSKVRALRKGAKGSKEGKDKLAAFQSTRIKKMAARRNNRRTSDLAYRRVIAGLPFKAAPKKSAKPAVASADKKKKTPKKVWISVDKAHKGKGKGKLTGRAKRDAAQKAAKLARANE